MNTELIIRAFDPSAYKPILDSISSPIYLDLGGALAAIGLIFAVYQLRKPQWDLVLRIRESWQRNLFLFLAGIGLLLVLFRVLLVNIEIHIGRLPYPFDLPIFYEVTAYLFFIASPLSLIFFSTRSRGLFTADSSRKFYEILIQEISKSNNEGLNASLEILLYNFRSICEVASNRNRNDESGQAARAILDVILSDESVVKILTTKRLDALQFIFAIVDKQGLSQQESGIGVPKLVQNLFYDRESFLYKHLDRDGLALSSNIYQSIFDSKTILTNFDLFGYPTLGYSMRKEIGIEGIKVFIEALSRTMKVYLLTGQVPPRHINDGLSHLSEIFSDLCFKISTEERRGVDTKYSLKDEWWALHLITNFLGHDYPFLAYQEKLNTEVVEREKTTQEADFYSDSTINAGIAAALYKGFVQLSYIKNTTDVYHEVLSLLHGSMYENQYKEGYRAPFEKRIWEQIAANVIGRHYPAPLRTYLEFIGFCLISDENQRQGWIGEQAERMRRLLYIDLKPLIDAGTEMVNKKKMKDALLPNSMDYRDGTFFYRLEFGEGEERPIAAPPEGSKSALEGVNLNPKSLL